MGGAPGRVVPVTLAPPLVVTVPLAVASPLIPVERGVVRTRHFVVGVRGLDVVSIRRPAAEGAEAIGLGAQRRGAADARQRAARAAAAQLAVESTLRARGGHSRAPRDAGLDQAV